MSAPEDQPVSDGDPTTRPEQSAPEQRLIALQAELQQAQIERDQALAARDAVVRQVLLVRPPGEAAGKRGSRRGLVGAVVLLLAVAAGLLMYQVVWTNRLLQRRGAAPAGAVDRLQPAAVHGQAAGRQRPRDSRELGLGPRRSVTIPITGLSLVGRAALAPDGRRVAVAGLDGQVLVYDLVRDRPVRLFRAHTGQARDVVFTPDGKLLTGGEDGAIHLWPLEQGAGKQRTLRARGAPVRRLALSGGRLAVAAEQDAVEVLALDGKVAAQRLAGHQGWVRAVAWSPADDGRTLLASGGHDGEVRLWSPDSTGGRLAPGHVLKGHTRLWISALAFGPRGRLLASAGFDRRIQIWSVADGKPLRTLEDHVRRVTDLAFDGDGRLASASLDRTVVLWAPGSWAVQDRLEGHRYQVNSVAFLSAVGARTTHLLSASSDGTLRLWPLGRPRPVAAAPLPPPGPGTITLRNNTSGERLRLRLHDGRGQPVATALPALAHFLRSGPDDRSAPPDPGLVKLLMAVAERFGRQREIVVISGYRSPQYNTLRTRQSAQVGERSLHMQGKAMDLRVEGVTITALHAYLLSLKAGGVGFYPDSQFVHMDVGPVRTWQGD